jgi:hypothetical protein
MSVFQWLAIGFLGALVAWEIRNWLRGGRPGGAGLLRCLVWLAAAAAIARPDWVQKVAEQIGVGRGADVVLYLFVLAFLATSFYFYSRCVRLQRQLTQVVRHIALQEGQHETNDDR